MRAELDDDVDTCELCVSLAGLSPRLGVNKALFMNNEFEYGFSRLFKLMNRAGADYPYS